MGGGGIKVTSGQDVEKLNSYTVLVELRWKAIREILKKLKTELPCPNNPTLSTHTKELNAGSGKVPAY